MDIRLITVKEDFERIFSAFYANKSHLSFYEFNLRHEFTQKQNLHNLIGLFEGDQCYGILSYEINPNHVLGKILHIKEIRTIANHGLKAEGIRGQLLDFIEAVAIDEKCDLVKMQYEHKEKLTNSIFDRFENYLRGLI